jgi:hypothetical protein
VYCVFRHCHLWRARRLRTLPLRCGKTVVFNAFMMDEHAGAACFCLYGAYAAAPLPVPPCRGALTRAAALAFTAAGRRLRRYVFCTHHDVTARTVPRMTSAGRVGALSATVEASEIFMAMTMGGGVAVTFCHAAIPAALRHGTAGNLLPALQSPGLPLSLHLLLHTCTRQAGRPPPPAHTPVLSPATTTTSLPRLRGGERGVRRNGRRERRVRARGRSCGRRNRHLFAILSYIHTTYLRRGASGAPLFCAVVTRKNGVDDSPGANSTVVAGLRCWS